MVKLIKNKTAKQQEFPKYSIPYNWITPFSNHIVGWRKLNDKRAFYDFHD